jgi:hypothetical protein
MTEETPDGPVTKEHMEAIGRVIVRWAMTERVISDSLWEISTGHSFESLPDTSISLALVTGMESRTALGILKAVFRARHPADADDFDKLVDRIDALRETRNHVAHGRWLKGKRPGCIESAHFRSSGSLKVVIHGFTSKELESLAERITGTTAEMMRFLAARGYWKPSSPPAKS